MSARTAQYLRVMLTPKDPDTGDYVDPSPSIAALSATACHLWEVLSNLAWHEDNTAVVGVETLARRMHRGERVVQRARAELVAAGVIAVDGAGGYLLVNRYRFPLGAPVEAVHRGDTHDTPVASTGVSCSDERGVVHDTLLVLQDPLVTSTDAVPRGDAEPLWRSVIREATERDDADRHLGRDETPCRTGARR